MTYLVHLVLLLSCAAYLCIPGNSFSYTYQSTLPRMHSLLHLQAIPASIFALCYNKDYGTFEHLSKNPSAIRSFNGKLGALVEEGWFMVTPNVLGLYQPPLGINWEMYIRADFRYGADDSLLWP
ncbi:hypothetical protein EDD18DRAFT_1103789 [Armillaria luteobubalina]|uniref:Uncharacterized protein n=1 Tax=Armillaria luteobubalina TaxID=153913 RepID=A0AA39TR40_9AGAR|nr:hypothetical protein EDD18DRAFT_1103789 [Armillaria luteobubalina]